MAYSIHDIVGAQPIATTSATQKHELGTIVRATDPVYGQGEFIYLLGVTNTIAGSVVQYAASTYQTVLATDATAKNNGGPVAVAMSANVGNQYGWYQISGKAVCNKTTTANPNIPLFFSTTAGKLRSTASAGIQVLGARSANTTTLATTVDITVSINRPHAQGQVT